MDPTGGRIKSRQLLITKVSTREPSGAILCERTYRKPRRTIRQKSTREPSGASHCGRVHHKPRFPLGYMSTREPSGAILDRRAQRMPRCPRAQSPWRCRIHRPPARTLRSGVRFANLGRLCQGALTLSWHRAATTVGGPWAGRPGVRLRGGLKSRRFISRARVCLKAIATRVGEANATAAVVSQTQSPKAYCARAVERLLAISDFTYSTFELVSACLRC